MSLTLLVYLPREIAAVVAELRVVAARDVRNRRARCGSWRCRRPRRGRRRRLFSEPEVNAAKGRPANVLTRGAVLSAPTVSPVSCMRGMPIGFVYSRWTRVVSSCVVALIPASSRTLRVIGFVHDTCCRRFGLIADRPPRFGRRVDRDDAEAGVLTEVLFVPEEVELVPRRRLPGDPGVHVAPHVGVFHAVLAAVGLVVEAGLAFPQVRPEVDAGPEACECPDRGRPSRTTACLS